MRPGYVYILTNKPYGVLYLGVTADLPERVDQHRSGAVPGFTKKYNCHLLVWFERFDDIQDARVVERQMKAWKREWKVDRIEELNPEWRDLFEQEHVW